MHLGDLVDNPLLVVAAFVVGGAVALLAAAAAAGRLWGSQGRAGPRAPSPAGPAAPAADEQTLRREWLSLTGHARHATDRAAQARAEATAARERSEAAEAIRRRAWFEYETAESPAVTAAARSAVDSRADGNAAVAGSAVDGSAVDSRADGNAAVDSRADGNAAVAGSAEAGSADGESLAHAAFVAFRSGAISARELQRVWSGTPAIADPRQAERLRDQARRAARESEAGRAYRRAAALARLTEEQARIAEVAAEALAAEAAAAGDDADAARMAVERYLGPRVNGDSGAGHHRP